MTCVSMSMLIQVYILAGDAEMLASGVGTQPARQLVFLPHLCDANRSLNIRALGTQARQTQGQKTTEKPVTGECRSDGCGGVPAGTSAAP